MNNTDQIIQILEETASKLRKAKAEEDKTASNYEELKQMIEEIREEITKIKGAII